MKNGEKGSISLYVLIACTFFITILMAQYNSSLNKMKAIEEEVTQIQDNYESAGKEISYNKEKGVNIPKVTDGMIPVKYNQDTGKWVICSSYDSEWYSYTQTEKKWANVMLSDGKYDTNAEIGTEVAENELGSMFVWIPRFAYKITEGYHTSTNGKISVVFLEETSDNFYSNKNNSSKMETATRNIEDIIDTNKKCYTQYIVHPCFTKGMTELDNQIVENYDNGEWRTELTGIWVAKFQAGIYTTSNDSKTQKTLITSNTANGLYYPVFKGRKFAYNYLSASQCYDLSMALDDNNNPYGLTEKANSHLMKNSEWGAVEYLSISEYGYSNGVASPDMQKSINNLSLNGSTTNIRNQSVYAVTGYSGSKGITQSNNTIKFNNVNLSLINEINGSTGKSYAWNNVDVGRSKGRGTESSTTGNIYGIYDMGGCLADYTASYVKSKPEYLQNGSSFATNISTYLATAYPVDNSSNNGIYDFNNNYNAYKNVYGDAIYETSYATSLTSNITAWFGHLFEGSDSEQEPFFPRGGTANFTSAVNGISAIGGDCEGTGGIYYGFHTVLAVE